MIYILLVTLYLFFGFLTAVGINVWDPDTNEDPEYPGTMKIILFWWFFLGILLFLEFVDFIEAAVKLTAKKFSKDSK